MEEKPAEHAEQQSHPEYGRWHEQANDDEKARQDDFQLRQEYRCTLMIYVQTEREQQRQVHALYLALLNHNVLDRVQALKDYHQAMGEYRVLVREYQVLAQEYRVSVQHYQQRVRDYWQTGQDRPARFYRPTHS